MRLFKDTFSKSILLVAVISVFLLAAYDVFFVFPSFNGLLMENSEEEAVHIASHLRDNLLSQNISLDKGPLPAAFITTAERARKDFHLWKIRVFSSSGEIVYSTDPADLGVRLYRRFFSEVVAKGSVYKKYVPKNEITPGGQKVNTDVVSAYVPVMKKADFLGACEVYMDVTGAIERNDRLLLTSFLTLFLLVFGLLLSLIAVSRRAGRSAMARKDAEDALEKSEQFLRTIIETEPECVKLIAPDNTLLMMNPAGLAMIGAASFEQVRGKRMSPLVLPEHREAFDSLTRNVFQGKSGTLEFEAMGLKGKRVWLSTHAVPLLGKNGGIAALLGITRDITSEKRSLEALEASLGEKEVLLRELYHRTKNNLQVISSLISLQASHINDAQILQSLEDTRNRIQAMSLVHEKLYKSKNLSRINARDYIEDLANALLGSYEKGAANVSLVLDADSTLMGVDTVTTLGLIINELMTNSLKYAFPDGRRGEIRISLRAAGGDRMEFVFSDNGVGLRDTDIKNVKSLGLKLVKSLATKQLGGKLEVKTGEGTEFRLTFKG